jgi:hypothetical protein
MQRKNGIEKMNDPAPILPLRCNLKYAHLCDIFLRFHSPNYCAYSLPSKTSTHLWSRSQPAARCAHVPQADLNLPRTGAEMDVISNLLTLNCLLEGWNAEWYVLRSSSRRF